MSQVVAPHPTSFFDKSREFNYQNQFHSEKDAFTLQQNVAELKAYSAYDSTMEGHNHGKHTSYNSFYQYSMPMYNMYTNGHISFSTKFPRVKDYLSKEAILETFPHLENVNDPAFDIDSISENAHFYVMRSSNDDNIHKAIKYHMWSTTASGKNTLSTAWQEAEKQEVAPEIYLIFSVVNSNHILGVAKMTSDINAKESFMYWWEPLKWFGSFQLKWIFIKDIPSAKVEHIKEAAFGQTPFINLKDNTRLSVETGKELLTIFKEYTPKSNIFESFAYMDQREDYIRLQRDNNTYFLKYFEEYCNAYQTNPERFSPGKKSQYHYKRGGRYNNYNNNNYYQRRQGGNTYYRKSYHNDRQPNSPELFNHNATHTTHHTRLVKGKPYQPKEEEFPVVSVAADQLFDLKASGKKLKSLRLKKSEKEGEENVEKTEEIKN